MPNPNVAPAVQAFFDQYARGRSALDLDLIASQYPDAFMMAGPKGARVVDKAMVLSAFTNGQAFLKANGYESTRVLAVEATALDQNYVQVRVQFAWRFDKTPAQPIDVKVASTFVLHSGSGTLRIVFQLEHHDFQQAMQASGVLPAKPK
jgi:hypothetical protein